MADSTTVGELVVTKFSDAISAALKGGHTESAELRGVSITRAMLGPGWGAEADRGGTEPDYCRSAHDIYVISGTLGLELGDGARTEITVGYVTATPPGHRGWTVGDERLVYLEFGLDE